MPNQLGIDSFDLADAEGARREHMASADLRAWMAENHLDLTLAPGSVGFAAQAEATGVADVFNPREAFGSHSDSDHVYNTPRAWYMQRCLNPSDRWDGPGAAHGPESDTIPWCRVPERKLTIEDVKYVLSAPLSGHALRPLRQARHRGHPRALPPHRHQSQRAARRAADPPLSARELPRRAVDGLWLQRFQRARALLHQR